MPSMGGVDSVNSPDPPSFLIICAPTPAAEAEAAQWPLKLSFSHCLPPGTQAVSGKQFVKARGWAALPQGWTSPAGQCAPQSVRHRMHTPAGTTATGDTAGDAASPAQVGVDPHICKAAFRPSRECMVPLRTVSLPCHLACWACQCRWSTASQLHWCCLQQ
jgi:hypothetical protein